MSLGVRRMTRLRMFANIGGTKHILQGTRLESRVAKGKSERFPLVWATFVLNMVANSQKSTLFALDKWKVFATCSPHFTAARLLRVEKMRAPYWKCAFKLKLMMNENRMGHVLAACHVKTARKKTRGIHRAFWNYKFIHAITNDFLPRRARLLDQ